MKFWKLCLRLLLSCVPVLAVGADDFLPPEQAFRFDARALDERSVEVGFTVAEGYYLYREQFKLASEDGGVTLGMAQIPAGKIKFDETFQKEVETHRGRLVFRVPVAAAPAVFKLLVTSQGVCRSGPVLSTDAERRRGQARRLRG